MEYLFPKMPTLLYNRYSEQYTITIDNFDVVLELQKDTICS